MIVTINDVKLDVVKHNTKNCYIGKFTNKNLPDIYGDTVSEVIEQAEETINEMEDE